MCFDLNVPFRRFSGTLHYWTAEWIYVSLICLQLRKHRVIMKSREKRAVAKNKSHAIFIFVNTEYVIADVHTVSRIARQEAKKKHLLSFVYMFTEFSRDDTNH